MGLFQKPPTGFFSLSYIFIYFFECETIVRSSVWSFGHSDPNPSSVVLVPDTKTWSVADFKAELDKIIQGLFLLYIILLYVNSLNFSSQQGNQMWLFTKVFWPHCDRGQLWQLC